MERLTTHIGIEPGTGIVGRFGDTAILIPRRDVDGSQSGLLAPARTSVKFPPIPAPLSAELESVSVEAGVGADADLVARVFIAVIEIFGALNFELFGQLNNTIDERHAWFDLQARVMADLVGLP